MSLAGAGLAAGALAAAGAWLWAAPRFRADMAAAQARLSTARQTATRHGPVAWGEAGAGAPVLVLHGAGGGFDQGLSVAGPLAARGYRVVALSRFGYPGSAAPPAGLSPAALTEAQAEAAADVLDALGIGRVAVAGISAGAAPALALARREPARVRAAVLLVPVLRLPDAPPPLDWGPLKRAAAERLLRSDLGLWAALRLARRRTVSALMATDAALLRRLPADERDRLEALIATLLPVRPRGAGYLMDAEAVTTPVPSALLSVAQPVLALAALDDRFGSAAIARALAAALPQGRAVTYASGGHLGVGCAAAMLDETAAFLDNLPP